METWLTQIEIAGMIDDDTNPGVMLNYFLQTMRQYVAIFRVEPLNDDWLVAGCLVVVFDQALIGE